MLLVVRHDVAHANDKVTEWWWERLCFTVYAADPSNDDDRWKFTPVSSLGDRALFLSNGNGCLSVSARDLPSLSRNSIYFSDDSHPVLMHSLTTRRTEDLAAECKIHDGKERIRPSVRPFTIADHLLTFCNPQQWTKGLMFHEYHLIPQSFTDLRKKIAAKELQQRFRAESVGESNKTLEKTTRELVDGLGNFAESYKALAKTTRGLADALIGLSCTMKNLTENIQRYGPVKEITSDATTSRSNTSVK
jgi:hypothetical protein